MKKILLLIMLSLALSSAVFSAAKRELSVFSIQEKAKRREEAELEAIKNGSSNTQIIRNTESTENNEEEDTLFNDEVPSKKKLNI